jgi:putative aminopeptidase FrvX
MRVFPPDRTVYTADQQAAAWRPGRQGRPSVIDDSARAEKDRIRELTTELAALDGVAGFEQPVVRRLVELLTPLADEVAVDGFGNVIATRRGRHERPHLMISAHSDEIGGVVRAIEPNGLIRFERLGGLLETLMVGRRVRVRGHRGVTGVRAGHVQTPEERLRVPPMRDLYVDLGLDSAAAVAALGIHVGDPIAYEAEMVTLANPDRLCGKALDNRLSCALLVRLLERLRGVELGGTLLAVVTVQEEVGLRGARVISHALYPDYAIVVDTLPTGDTPDVDFYRELAIRLGDGPVIPLVSGAAFGNGNILHPAIKRLLLETAAREGIPVQPALFTQSMSDLAAVHLARGGIPAGAINIPRRYAHSPVETADLNDALQALRLMEAVARDLGPEVPLGFLD